ncbi:hypothetical protein Tco_1555388 [Tanacetum coccineum]
MKNQETPKVNGKNWNEMMERELGEGYSFIKKKCFVCSSLSHLIRDCDFYEKKMAREAELKKQRVFNTGNGVAKPVWNNANRVNHANHFVPRPVQLNAVRQNVNSVRSNVNTVRQNVKSVRSNINIVRPKQPVPTSNPNSVSSVRPQDHPLKNMEDKGIFDSGCSGHMIGNKDHMDDFEEFKRGSVTFGVKQKTDGNFISRDKYVADMLKKFDLTSVKTAITPMETKMALTKDEEADEVDVHLYRSMIGSLMYLTASRPDIMFAVCACSRFQVTPKTSHLNAVKRIFKYLKGKPNLGLWYPRESSFALIDFSNSDYAGANLDRKSTIGGCQFLGSRLISWQCKKQTIVATSTTEAEYVAAASCCGQVLWIQNQMLDYGFNFMNTKIHIDNKSTICIVKNPVWRVDRKDRQDPRFKEKVNGELTRSKAS